MYASRRCGLPTRSDKPTCRTIGGTKPVSARSYLVSERKGTGEHTANTLSTDFDLMRSVAGTTDARNEEIRAMLQAFIGRMS